MARKRSPSSTRRRSRFRGLGTAGIIVAVSLLVWIAINSTSLAAFLKAYRERNRTLDNVVGLRKRLIDLEGEKLSLKVGTFQTEKIARETLILVKPGEVLIRLDTPGDTGREEPVNSEKSP